MKYFFIVNPAAGKGKTAAKLYKEISTVAKERGLDYEICCTKCSGDARSIAKKLCEKWKDQEKTIFACGGDGLVSEVVSGLFGFDKTILGVIPAGTGNDFVRSFTRPDLFLDPDAQFSGSVEAVDVIRYHDRCSINVLNMGFDCSVVKSAERMKHLPLVQSSSAYLLGCAATLIEKPGLRGEMSVDGGPFEKIDALLLLAANGRYYGGGFCPAPIALMQDGFIDLCIVKNVSRAKFVSMVGIYQKGKHLKNQRVKNICTYRRCKSLDFRFEEDTDICGDGEIMPLREFHAELVPGAIRLLIPSGSDLLRQADPLPEAESDISEEI